MKIGVNTYSFGRKSRSDPEAFLREILQEMKDIPFIGGIELLDDHIPGWDKKASKALLSEGIKRAKAIVEEFGMELYALGPHLQTFREDVEEFQLWFELAHEHQVPNVRCNFGGFPGSTKGFMKKLMYQKYLKKTITFLEKVLPIAQINNVRLGIETHWGYSSDPYFIKELTDHFKETAIGKHLGVIFDWGNFHTPEDRERMLEISAEPHNHIHNHVKANGAKNENWIETDFRRFVDRFVKTFKAKGFSEYLSIESSGMFETADRMGFKKVAHILNEIIQNNT